MAASSTWWQTQNRHFQRMRQFVAARLSLAIDDSGYSVEEVSEAAGVHFTTTYKILRAEHTVLPMTGTILRLAAELKISVDWLFDLSGASIKNTPTKKPRAKAVKA